MQIDILSVTIRAGVVNVLIAPQDIGVKAVKDYIDNYPYDLLYVCGNYSVILTNLKGKFDVRRAFTVYQLFSILEECYQDAVFIEHDRLLYEDVEDAVIENLFSALKDVARRGKLVIYYSNSTDRVFEYFARNADRFIHFEEDCGGYFIVDSSYYPEVNYRRLYHRFLPKSQTTLEVF
ncbi:hypothetical protein DRP07_06250 [Archaeoglobales archaeon]|nr:MAG: hypothetical protein DRP07_06250 [Archaeoglobales archaeon]